MTWEPEENLQYVYDAVREASKWSDIVALRESAGDILSNYLESIGGREKIFEETQEAAKGKKRSRTASTAQAANTKRSKRNGTHPSESTPPVSSDKWNPPAGSWEDEIDTIDACEDEGSGRLIVYLVWKNGRKTKHDTKVIYKKCPQKVSVPPYFSRIGTQRAKFWGGFYRCWHFTNAMCGSSEKRIGSWPNEELQRSSEKTLEGNEERRGFPSPLFRLAKVLLQD